MLASLRRIAEAAIAKAIAQKLSLALGSIAPALLGAVLCFRDYLAPLLADPTGTLSLLFLSLLIATILISLSAYFWSHPKLKHIQSLGVHKDIKTGNYYCSRCYLKDKKSHPLKAVHHAWQCHVCGNRVDNPDDPLIPMPAYSPFRKNP